MLSLVVESDMSSIKYWDDNVAHKLEHVKHVPNHKPVWIDCETIAAQLNLRLFNYKDIVEL